MVDIRDTDESNPADPPANETPPDLSLEVGPEEPSPPALEHERRREPDGTGGFEARYDPARDDSLVCVVIDAVATAAGCDPLEVEPLYDRINPEALEALFAPGSTVRNRQGRVSFSIENHLVTVTDGYRVRVEPMP